MPEQVFIAGFVVLVAAGIVDMVGYLAFWPPVYLLGPRIYSDTRPWLAPPAPGTRSAIETAHGKFSAVSGERVLIRERQLLWDFWRSDVRGSIVWGPQGVTIEARFPLFTMAIMVLWLVVFVVSAVGAGLEALAASLFIGVIIIVSIVRQRNRMRLLLSEYEDTAARMPPHA
jgi:hypothetical protein